MPALLTHYLCGNTMLKHIDNETIRELLIKERSVFNLGTQGPDIFFYYGAWPWIDSSKINRFGDRMHEEKTGTFILEALKYLKESKDTAKNILTAYLCGYLCHYALDCNTHPYIFYKSGFVRRGEEYTSKYTCYHRMFETALDVLMLKHELNKKPADFDSSAQVRVEKEASVIIGAMYKSVLKKVYDYDIDTQTVCTAIADIAKIPAVLRDKSGIKKRILGGVEKSLGKLPMFSSMILPQEIKDGLDYLNTTHSDWHLPWDNTVVLNSTFIDGFEAASKESKYFAEAVHRFQSGDLDMESLAKLIGNRSFSTGKDCSLDLDFKYYDCIFE